MIPRIYPIVAASAAVSDLLGPSAQRFYPFGEAPQAVAAPYATWQTVTGLPENYLAQRPDADSYGVQIDVYAETVADCLAVATALRDALEPVAYITRWGSTLRDQDTRLYRYSFDVDLIDPRS